MGVFYEAIPPSLQKWILEQKLFYIATAPLSGSGHINVSPKGGPYFGIIDEKTFWYHDLSGSGIETIAHLHEPGNGRAVVMFNAFEGPPKIVRLWGKGRVLESGTPEFQDHITKYDVKTIPGTRSIIIIDIHQVGSSCGFSVPYYDFKDYRPILNDHFKKKEKKYLEGNENESMDRYWAFKSAYSMDGLPAMQRGLAVGKNLKIAPLKKMVGPLAPKVNGVKGGSDGFTLEQLVIVFITAFIAGLMVMFAIYPTIANLVASVPKEQTKTSWLDRSFR